MVTWEGAFWVNYNPAKSTENSDSSEKKYYESSSSDRNFPNACIEGETDRKSKQKFINNKKKDTDSDCFYESYNPNNSGGVSRNSRKGIKPPTRPSKSGENNREVFTSGEYRSKYDEQGFLEKLIPRKDLVRDKDVFKRKSKKKLMQNIDKILENKENAAEDPQILRLKSMLASRQLFKKKHVEIPKDHPYNQKIVTVLSDGNTPYEDYKVDSAVLKKREERLKRISSIYSNKPSRDSASRSKTKKEKLSPSKSDNSIKRGNYL